jgi:hypothetical protein
VLASQCRNRAITVLASQPFEDSLILFLRGLSQAVKVGARGVADDHRVDASRARSCGADLGRGLGRGVEGAGIGGHELFAARYAGQRHQLVAGPADVMPNSAVPIDV